MAAVMSSDASADAPAIILNYLFVPVIEELSLLKTEASLSHKTARTMEYNDSHTYSISCFNRQYIHTT